MCTNNKIHKKFCVLEGKFTWIWIKFGDLTCQFVYVTQISITCTCINMKQLKSD